MLEQSLTPAEAYSKDLRMQYPGQFPTDLKVVLRILETSSWEYEWVDGELIDKHPCSDPYVMTEEGWGHFRNGGNDRPPTSWRSPNKDSALFVIPDNAAKHWLDFIHSQLHYLIRWDVEDVNTWIRCYYNFQRQADIQRRIEESREAFTEVRAAVITIRNRIGYIRAAEYRVTNPPPVEIAVGSWVRSKTGSVFSTVKEIDDVAGAKCGSIVRLDPPLEHPVFGVRAWWSEELLTLLEKNQCPHCGVDLTGDPIPEESRKSYGGATHFSRRISHVNPDLDRATDYECPDCNGRWVIQKGANL